jgi:hypothetical protein
MATINHKTYNEGTETFKDFSVYDGKDTLIFKVDGSAQSAAVTGTLAVSGNATFDTDTLFVDAASNEVGIGTASPQSIFHIGANAPANAGEKAYTGLANTAEGFLFDYYYDTTASNLRLFDVVPLGAATTGIGGSALRFFTVPQTPTNTPLERMRITAAGNVGIGTTAPAVKLDVAGRVNAAGDDYHSFSVDQGSAQIRLERTGTSTGVNYIGSDNRGLLITDSAFSTLAIFTANGLTFNGDTLAANALDDYEEGTFTPTILFGGASVGVTYAAGRAGQYTKIGRQVTVTAYILLTSKGSSTGTARISGLPFTITNESGYYAAGSLGALVDITYGGQIQTYAEIGSTSYVLNDYSEAGVQGNTTDADFSNVSQIIFTATYYA